MLDELIKIITEIMFLEWFLLGLLSKLLFLLGI